MASEGIELSAPETKLGDPYMNSRHLPTHSYTSHSTYDHLRQFLEMDRHVLCFYCVWDDRDSMFGDMKPYVSLSEPQHTCTFTHCWPLCAADPALLPGG